MEEKCDWWANSQVWEKDKIDWSLLNVKQNDRMLSNIEYMGNYWFFCACVKERRIFVFVSWILGFVWFKASMLKFFMENIEKTSES